VARVNLADPERLTGRDAEAEALLRETVSLQPTAAVAWHALGLTLVRRGQRTEAVTALGRAFALAPADPDYAYGYALALHETGHEAEARTTLQRALAVQPGSTDLASLLTPVQSAAARR
jgi:Flp pilus assembly protein TadD